MGVPPILSLSLTPPPGFGIVEREAPGRKYPQVIFLGMEDGNLFCIPFVMRREGPVPIFGLEVLERAYQYVVSLGG